MKLSDFLFILITFTVVFGWFLIATHWPEIRTRLVNAYLWCRLKVSTFWWNIKRTWKSNQKRSRLTDEEEKEIMKNHFNEPINEPLGIGA